MREKINTSRSALFPLELCVLSFVAVYLLKHIELKSSAQNSLFVLVCGKTMEVNHLYFLFSESSRDEFSFVQ